MSTATLTPTAIHPADDDGIVFDPITHDSIGPARQYAHLRLIDTDYDLAADAVLVVAELVTNALLHGRMHVTLTVHAADGLIEITVTDEGDRTATVDDRPEGERGRGRFIVESLADRVEAVHAHAGTTIRALLRSPSEGNR